MTTTFSNVIGTGRSMTVTACQSCGTKPLELVLFLGFLPPVNTMTPIGECPAEQTFYPAEMLRCPQCTLVQLGCVVDPMILFPDDYAYTSGTTRILRENFAELAREVNALFSLAAEDLVVDIGSNDGTLLSNFKGRQRVCGIEPTDASALALAAGIPTLKRFFDHDAAADVRVGYGRAKLVTATNVFAHIDDVHAVIENVLSMLTDDGLFVVEAHYLLSLVETIQYDTVYHEHLRYYSLSSLAALLEPHGLWVVDAKEIPTHGGSVRVYASRERRPISERGAALLEREKKALDRAALERFAERTAHSKRALNTLLDRCRQDGPIYGVGAPSRASTLVNYTGIDERLVDCVLEIAGSHKIGKYLPGTRIPVLAEEKLISDQPPYVLLLSWHIAEDLIDLMRRRGFTGKFIIPLPEPRVID